VWKVVGEHIRAFHRRSAVGSWKGNVGSSVLEEVDVDDFPQYRRWADAVRPICGGLDIYTVDAIHCENGEEVILEINDSASGFAPTRLAEDMKMCAELVIERLQASRRGPAKKKIGRAADKRNKESGETDKRKKSLRSKK
jgi:glutathione synthase/RimK-type ligase-like ATP-grasp enzyme